MKRSTRRSARLICGLALAMALAFAGSAGVSADTLIAHHGPTGVASLRDQSVDQKGGARCDYSFSDMRNGGAATIKVHAPRVFARNRTAGTDHQVVGWRVILQQTPDDINYGRWYTVFHSQVVKLGATDSVKAPFKDRTFNVPFNTFVRARVQVFWYTPGSNSVVQGWQLRSVDHYDRYLDGTFEDQVADNCPQDLTNP
jgi:hypothetical protein